MNEKYNWNDHIDKLIIDNKYKLYTLRKSQYFLKSSIQSKLIKSIILLKILYCCNIYIESNKKI
jgi:hypothetical protein